MSRVIKGWSRAWCSVLRRMQAALILSFVILPPIFLHQKQQDNDICLSSILPCRLLTKFMKSFSVGSSDQCATFLNKPQLNKYYLNCFCPGTLKWYVLRLIDLYLLSYLPWRTLQCTLIDWQRLGDWMLMFDIVNEVCTVTFIILKWLQPREIFDFKWFQNSRELLNSDKFSILNSLFKSILENHLNTFSQQIKKNMCSYKKSLTYSKKKKKYLNRRRKIIINCAQSIWCQSKDKSIVTDWRMNDTQQPLKVLLSTKYAWLHWLLSSIQ